MSKPYFLKYLPVEGEIKEGDVYLSSTEGFSDRKTGEFLKEPYWVTIVTEVTETYIHITHLNGRDAGAIPLSSKPKKSKLFLCSRDIQVGDELTWIGSGKNPGETPFGGKLKHDTPLTRGKMHENWIKVIGEISPDALSYVKEDDEFDENEVEIFYWDNEDLEEYDYYQANHKEMLDMGFIIYVKLKGPCGHFH